MKYIDDNVSHRTVFCHEQLKLARLASGKSFIDIGNILGVSRQYAHKLEIDSIPSKQQLEILAKELLVTPEFFFKNRKRSLELEQCHFRSLRTSTQTLKKMVAAQVELFEVFIHRLEQEVNFPEINILEIEETEFENINQIETIAENFRIRNGLGLGPLSNITKLAEKMGILVINVAEVDDRVDAFSIFNERPIIVRNTAKENPCRLRFDIAHEIGHLILHQGIESGDRLTEGQANQFASALLMPRTSLAAEFPEMRGQYLNWDALTEMKLRWKVSYKALIYRANKLGLLTPSQAKAGFTYLARHGFTKSEKYDDLVAMEEPSLVQKAINILSYKTWQTLLDECGLSKEAIVRRYLLKPPMLPNLKIVS